MTPAVNQREDRGVLADTKAHKKLWKMKLRIQQGLCGFCGKPNHNEHSLICPSCAIKPEIVEP